MQGEGIVSELILLDGAPCARVRCPPGIIPAPGQYVLAYAAGSDLPLADSLFAAGVLSDGVVTAQPVRAAWSPGTRLHLRGPLGHGFRLPTAARRIALVPFTSPARTLLSLLEHAFRQQAAVTLVGDDTPDDLPLQVEVQPAHALPDVMRWADFAAFEITRELLPEFKGVLQGARQAISADGQVLVRTPMPCGALAACGVCSVDVGKQALLACEDGPVFGLDQMMGWSSKA